MKIGFIDCIFWDYNLKTVYEKPLGGSQSAICYLLPQLVASGHEVYLFNNTSKPEIIDNIYCLRLKEKLFTSESILCSLDIIVILNLIAPELDKKLRNILTKKQLLILWIQNNADAGDTQTLDYLIQNHIYDGIALLSNWQRNIFYQYLHINLEKTGILRNAISPLFSNLFPTESSILQSKSSPPILAYTSTPQRGLKLLLEVFPQIREAIPGTILRVFSSMKVYQIDKEKDRAQFGELYQLCQETEGVEYIGSIPQTELAQQLKSINVFAYPNTFPETSCIAAMEAMASGCYVITSELAALPETTAGFARLIPMIGTWENYQENFIKETVEVLRQYQGEKRDKLENHLREQVNFVNKNYTWSNRAQEWLEWLAEIKAQKYLAQKKYQDLINFCEQEISISPQINNNYWYLGLGLLLLGDEITAQTTWMSGMLDEKGKVIETRQQELLQLLEKEFKRLTLNGDRQKLQLVEIYLNELSSSNL